MRDSSPSLLGNHCLVAEMRAWCSVEGPVYLGSSSGCHFLAMSSGNLLNETLCTSVFFICEMGIIILGSTK